MVYKKVKKMVATGLVLGGGALVLDKFGSATGQTAVTNPAVQGMGSASGMVMPIMGADMAISSFKKLKRRI